MLALNIGIIDPGWSGPVASFLLNFGKTSRAITVGESFLRVTCHELYGPDIHFKPVSVSKERYLVEKRQKILSVFGEFFLNVPEIVREHADVTFQDTIKKGALWFTVATSTIALLTFFANSGLTYVATKYFQPADGLKVIESQLDRDRAQQQKMIQQLEDQVKALEARLERSAVPSSSQAVGPVAQPNVRNPLKK